MSEEKLFDVNWDQRKWETPASAQDMKLYSYPPRTIRNMSVPGFLTWLVLLLASIGGLLYTAWMTVTGWKGKHDTGSRKLCRADLLSDLQDKL